MATVVSIEKNKHTHMITPTYTSIFTLATDMEPGVIGDITMPTGDIVVLFLTNSQTCLFIGFIISLTYYPQVILKLDHTVMSEPDIVLKDITGSCSKGTFAHKKRSFWPGEEITTTHSSLWIGHQDMQWLDEVKMYIWFTNCK